MGADCGLHPLMHTFLEFKLAQDMDFYKCEENKTPISHLLSRWGQRRGLSHEGSNLLTPWIN
jgi:hypothetical protein